MSDTVVTQGVVEQWVKNYPGGMNPRVEDFLTYLRVNRDPGFDVTVTGVYTPNGWEPTYTYTDLQNYLNNYIVDAPEVEDNWDPPTDGEVMKNLGVYLTHMWVETCGTTE